MDNVLMGTLNPTHSLTHSLTNRSRIVVVTTAYYRVMLLISRPTATAESATGAIGWWRAPSHDVIHPLVVVAESSGCVSCATGCRRRRARVFRLRLAAAACEDCRRLQNSPIRDKEIIVVITSQPRRLCFHFYLSPCLFVYMSCPSVSRITPPQLHFMRFCVVLWLVIFWVTSWPKVKVNRGQRSKSFLRITTFKIVV